jgi:hypothetical protein
MSVSDNSGEGGGKGGSAYKVRVQFLKEDAPHLTFNFESMKQTGLTFKNGLQAANDPVLFGLGCTKQERMLKLKEEINYARTAYAATVLQRQVWKRRLTAARMELERIGVQGADHNAPQTSILKALERRFDSEMDPHRDSLRDIREADRIDAIRRNEEPRVVV